MPSWTGLTDNIQAINGLCSSETGTPFPLLLTMAEKQRKERRKSLKSRTQHMPKSGAEATPWKLLPTFLFQKQLQASFGHLKITHNKEWMEFLDKTKHYSLANLWEHDVPSLVVEKLNLRWSEEQESHEKYVLLTFAENSCVRGYLGYHGYHSSNC